MCLADYENDAGKVSVTQSKDKAGSTGRAFLSQGRMSRLPATTDTNYRLIGVVYCIEHDCMYCLSSHENE